MKDWIFKTLKKGFRSLAIDLGIVGLIIIGIGIYLFMNPEVVSAQVYQPLAPITGITDQPSTDLGSFISNIYDVSIGIGVVLAIVMLTISGLQYSSSVIPAVKGKAKKTMLGAVLGLLLLLSSYLILNTINPDLTVLEVDLETATTTLEDLPRTQEEVDRELLSGTSTAEFSGAHCVYIRENGSNIQTKSTCYSESEKDKCDASARLLKKNPFISAYCGAGK